MQGYTLQVPPPRLACAVTRAGAQMKASLVSFVGKWARLVVGVRLVLTAVFLPMMVFGFVVFPDTRLVTLAAVAILSLIAVRDIKSLRKSLVNGRLMERADSAEYSLLHGSKANCSFSTISSSVFKLCMVHGVVIGIQICGAVITWWVMPTYGLPALLGGGASVSVFGFGLGIWLDRIGSNAWASSPSMLRRIYMTCAVGMTVLGIALLIVLRAGVFGAVS